MKFYNLGDKTFETDFSFIQFQKETVRPLSLQMTLSDHQAEFSMERNVPNFSSRRSFFCRILVCVASCTS